MCASGNQTISKSCYTFLLAQTGKTSLSNKEARRLLAEHGGCVSSKGVITEGNLTTVNSSV